MSRIKQGTLALGIIFLAIVGLRASESSEAYRIIGQEILTNPAQVLMRNLTDWNDMRPLIEPHMNDENSWNTCRQLQQGLFPLIEKKQEENPLFLLRECTIENYEDPNSHCPLSRTMYPWVRDEYKNRVVALLTEAKSNLPAETILEYVDVGAGNLFQLLEILHHFLQNNPSARIHVHLIDTQYVNVTRQENGLPVVVDYMNKVVLGNGGCIDDLMPKDTINQFLIPDIIHAFRYKQLENIIKLWHPAAYVAFCLHATVGDYLLAVNNAPGKPYADVISAIDINLDTQNGYRYLCTEILTKKPTMNNIACIKMQFPGSDAIRQFWVVPVPKKNELGVSLFSSYATMPQECVELVEPK